MLSQSSIEPMTDAAFQPDEAFARNLDDADPLARFREHFHIPVAPNGEPAIYFCGNSLGLQPRAARAIVERELDDWATLAVEAHFKGATPWYSYHETLSDAGARLVGARPGGGEVVMMNSLTVNLHLMLVTFYRPTPARYKILIDEPTFPSDLYALQSHLKARGLAPAKIITTLRPRAGEHLIRDEDIREAVHRDRNSLSLVLLSGVNFYTGQLFDIPAITKLVHGLTRQCMVGFDLAHAAGNVPLRLHEWNVDFACWCSYKYLNAGPGAVAGCFVHERHGRSFDLPRFAGWWGNDPETRFRMQLIPDFLPRAGADGWQISNPPIFSMAPLRASLRLFDEAGMDALRAKSIRLTGYLRWLIERTADHRFEIITPEDGRRRGCQLSILVHDRPRERLAALEAAHVVCDYREPNVIRVAPAPLYNTFHEAWRFAQILGRQFAD